MEIPRKQKRLLQKSIALTLTCGVLLAGSAYAAAASSTASDWDGPEVDVYKRQHQNLGVRRSDASLQRVQRRLPLKDLQFQKNRAT